MNQHRPLLRFGVKLALAVWLCSLPVLWPQLHAALASDALTAHGGGSSRNGGGDAAVGYDVRELFAAGGEACLSFFFVVESCFCSVLNSGTLRNSVIIRTGTHTAVSFFLGAFC